MKASRLAALGLVAGAALWIGSGYIFGEHPHSDAAIRPAEQASKPAFRVAVLETKVEQHARKLVISGRTEADHKMMALARTSGLLLELKVRRGDQVKQGDVIARLSDEAREAQVAQARALVSQRKAELEAKRRLAESGAVAKLDLANVEAQAKAADAILAAADAEAERGLVVAPWSGIITEVPVQPGQSLVDRQGSGADRRARSDAGGGRSRRAQARRRQGWRARHDPARHRRDRRGQDPLCVEVGELRPPAPIASTSRWPILTVRSRTASPPKSRSSWRLRPRPASRARR